MKRFLAVMLTVMLLAGMIPAALAANQYGTVVGGWLRLRAAASFDAETITSYYTGTQVELLSKTGSWYRVLTPDGRTGYMYGDYLQVSQATVPVTPTGKENAWVTSHNGYGVRLRRGPSTSYRTIRTYDVGTPVTILQHGTYWSKIDVGGTVGYMMTQFLQVGGSAPGTAETIVGYATIWSSNGYGVRLRSGPGTGYGKIGVYSVGTSVAILEKGAAWDRIRVGGRVGWMMNDFLIYQNENEVTQVSLNTLSPKVGTVMSVHAITPSKATVSHEWLVDGTVRGTSSTYTVTAADVGKTIQLRVKGTGAFTGTATSAVTAKVLSETELESIRLNTTAPVVGDTLSVSITPAGADVNCAWKVDGVEVSNLASLSVTSAYAGKTITVIVTGRGLYHGTKSLTTAVVASTAVVADVSISNATSPNAAAPTVGEQLKANLTPVQAVVSYQWKRDGVDIAGATGATYVLTDLDVGKQITVYVKGAQYYSGEKLSAATAKVLAKPVVPVIDGIGLPEGLVGQSYSTRLSAQGGGTITWKLADGSSLPAGLSLQADGAITGTPTAAGSTTFYVIASNAAGASQAKGFVIQVNAPVTYTLTIQGGDTQSGLAKDAAVIVTAPAPASGKLFSGWILVSGNGTFDNAASLSTTFRMAASDAVIQPTYADVSQPVQTYTLTVENGSGSASGLTANAEVSIVANAPASGKVFDKWVVAAGGTVADANSTNTTFRMAGGDAKVTATYKDAPVVVPTTYTLTVENGSGSASGLPANAEVSIVANTAAEGKMFDKWVITAGNGTLVDEYSTTTVFRMAEANAAVAATYKDAPVVVPTTYTLTVENGSGSASGLAANVEVSIVANTAAEGKVFDKWVITAGNGTLVDEYSTTTIFRMAEANATVAATYKDVPVVVPTTYTLTVENGTAAKTSDLSATESVAITAEDPAARGENFAGWTLVSGAGTFADASAVNTTFTMAGSNAAIKANYEPIVPTTYTLTVNGGEGSQSGLTAGTAVPINAPAPEAGKQFKGWVIDSGDGSITDPGAQSTTFTVGTSDATVRPTYEDVKYTLTVVDGTGSQSDLMADQTVSISANVPGGMQFSHWEITAGDGIVGSEANTTFQMKGTNATVQAKFTAQKYSLTVNGGSADKTSLEAGEMANLTANAPNAGEEFDYWSVSGSGSVSGSTFTMGDGDATVTAVYKAKELTRLESPSITWAEDGMSISWTPISGAAGYEYRYQPAGQEAGPVQSTADTSCTFAVAAATGDVFSVRAIGDGVNTKNSGWAEITY